MGEGRNPFALFVVCMWFHAFVFEFSPQFPEFCRRSIQSDCVICHANWQMSNRLTSKNNTSWSRDMDLQGRPVLSCLIEDIMIF